MYYDVRFDVHLTLYYVTVLRIHKSICVSCRWHAPPSERLLVEVGVKKVCSKQWLCLIKECHRRHVLHMEYTATTLDEETTGTALMHPSQSTIHSGSFSGERFSRLHHESGRERFWSIPGPQSHGVGHLNFPVPDLCPTLWDIHLRCAVLYLVQWPTVCAIMSPGLY